jgi:hypothetical protein
VIFTFAHEPNAAGQYPWAQGDTGSCGSSPCTPAQWIAAWDAVQAQVDGNGAGQYAYWMWAPNADTGGSTVAFTPWWPGAAHVDMVGIDGYPQSGPGWGLCNFRELFGQSFTEMRSLTSLPVFISETDLAPLSTTGDCNGQSYETITDFMSDLFSDGGDGILQFQDGTTALTSAQWSELDAALAKAPHPAPSPAGSPAPPPVPASTPATGKQPRRGHEPEFPVPDAKWNGGQPRAFLVSTDQGPPRNRQAVSPPLPPVPAASRSAVLLMFPLEVLCVVAGHLLSARPSYSSWSCHSPTDR